MRNVWLTLGALCGLLAVGAGAFGAHALKEHLPADRLETYHLAARYQLWHALALLAVGLLADRSPRRALSIAGGALLIGVIVFSGSLYALSLSGVRTWGAVTPIGGVSLMIGWGALAWYGATSGTGTGSREPGPGCGG